jgi:hypothetical protein
MPGVHALGNVFEKESPGAQSEVVSYRRGSSTSLRER